MHYTIVLTPPEDQRIKYIEASQSLYGDCQPSYILTNDGTSSPHITVVQFDCPSEELAHRIWFRVCEKLRAANFELFSPKFTGTAFVDGEGSYAGTTWVELSVSRGEIDSPIMKLHYTALEVLNDDEFKIKPLNAIGNNFRPHLTETRCAITSGQAKICPKAVYENPGKFNVEWGCSDSEFQYVKTLEVYQP